MTKLTSVATIRIVGSLTYEEVVMKHLSKLSDKQKNAKIDSMLIISDGELGVGFGILGGDNILEIIGLANVVVNHLATGVE